MEFIELIEFIDVIIIIWIEENWGEKKLKRIGKTQGEESRKTSLRIPKNPRESQLGEEEFTYLVI